LCTWHHLIDGTMNMGMPVGKTMLARGGTRCAVIELAHF